MGSGNLRSAIGAIKDQTSINLAKIATFSDLRVAIVKATGHKVRPAKEHHIHEILTLTSYSRHHANSCLATISKRLNKTKDWVVTLKTLILIQRLMQDGNPTFMHEFFVAPKNGVRLLDMSGFQNAAWANSWDFSAFIRAYTLYLREQLESWIKEQEGRCGMFSYAEDENEYLSPDTVVLRTTPVREMENHQIYSRIQHLMKLLDSFLACRPTGAAKNNRIVAIALIQIVKQSFHIYHEITEIMSIFQDRLQELNAVDSTMVLEIFYRVEKQYRELDTFYYWCIHSCIATPSDYPEVEKISHETLVEMDKTIKEKIEMEKHELESEPEPEPEYEPEPESESEFESEPEPEPEHEEDIEPRPQSEVSKDENEKSKTQEIGDLLSFEDDNFDKTGEHSDQLALALFGNSLVAVSSEHASEKPGTQPWEEAVNESGDWETTLVHTASQLPNQEPSLPRGFDPLILDEMYQQAATNSNMITNGSASSVAFGSAISLTSIALPAAPPSASGSSPGGDPFAASLAVAPPLYVQMCDIEKKKRLFKEEKIMWQGYQGQVGMANLYMNQYPYNMAGGYT